MSRGFIDSAPEGAALDDPLSDDSASTNPSSFARLRIAVFSTVTCPTISSVPRLRQ
jgi:hypothetical protein